MYTATVESNASENLENIDVFIQFYQIATRENFHPCDQASIYGMHSIQMVKFLQLEEIAERQKKRVATDIGYVWDCVHAVVGVLSAT